MQIHAQKIIAIICQLHLEMTLKHHTEMRIDKVLFKKCIKLRSTMKKGIKVHKKMSRKRFISH